MTEPMPGPGDRRAYVWGIQAMRLSGLAALVATIYAAKPRPGLHGRGLAISVVLAVATVAWLALVAMDLRGRRTTVPLAVMGLAGGVLAALQPNGPAIVVAAVACLAAGTNLGPQPSIPIAVASGAALAVGALFTGAPSLAVLGFLVIIGTALGMGLIRYEMVRRAVTAEELLAQTRRAARAEAEAAALNERTRIAREIHDILAHSLGALAMQVEAAQALLSQEEPDVAKALGCVERAGQLTRTGLTESRRAILALREDPGLLPDALAGLIGAEGGVLADGTAAEGMAADGLTTLAAPTTLTTSGEPRRLPPDATLALFRTAQEAVTNARKHAPGRPVSMELEFGDGEVVLQVVNQLADADTDRPLTDSGAGVGLTGLRERAELAGGTLEAGAVGTEWRVRARVPG